MKCKCSPWFWRNALFLASGVTLVAYFVAKHEVISNNVKPEFNPKLETLPVKDLPVVRGEMREGFGLDSLIAVTPAKIEKGHELYQANCLGCHGADAKGNAALGSRNLTDPKGGTWLNGTKFSDLFGTLSNGVGKMPSFGTLSVPERIALVHYIQSLGDYTKPDAAEKAVLDQKFALSKPAKSPNQVPVSRAMEMMLKDTAAH